MKRQAHRGKLLDKVDGARVIDCTSCGFIHVMPLPSAATLEQFYTKDFYEHERPRYFTETKADLSWWNATYTNYYRHLEQATKGRRLLDVGSGPGHFLNCGKKRGWNVVGVEPSPTAARYAQKRGLQVLNDFFSNERAKQLGTFDVVHASFVLEHVPDPIAFIEDMKKLLKPRGVLTLVCPNDYNPLQLVLQREENMQPWWVVPDHHLNYFTVASAQRLLTRMGCSVVETLGSFPLETFILSGKNYVGDHALGRVCHTERKKFELALYAKQPALLDDLYRGLARAGIGREFFIIAKKDHGS